MGRTAGKGEVEVDVNQSRHRRGEGSEGKVMIIKM